MRGLSRLRQAQVLHGLSIQARAGSVVTVIGPNGAGKSTTLNALVGLLPLMGGSILLDGQDVRASPWRSA
ncbi:MAG UNVERIFIED_CONTAM: ATP-binding cassette domain-containing protein [Microcystis novacekii LVE1205-3]